MPTLPTSRRVPFVANLGLHGERTAVITAEGRVSYQELYERVAATARWLGDARRLVLVAGANELEPLVTYLGALAAGHPVLLASADGGRATESLIRTYDPDIVLRPGSGGWTLDERRSSTVHDLHPDLALLLSTSGSTGSPKLVRLSHRNLQANAEAIAEYLGIRESDRAATTLPMHYCYGLSVVHSHLLRGAGVILTASSVVDACFWDQFRQAEGTTLAGVPHTFELLDGVGFDRMRLPHLRYVTQAGGRLAPEKVRRYAELGRRQGWDLVVMYGQTEATARMAYLPPELAASHPHTIGVPIPGGAFRLDPVPEAPEPEAGELVYRGANVMMGYAEAPADLAAGRTVEELRTGDLARRTPDGLYEIVGRRSRFAKVAGLRVDLNRVERLLADQGIPALAADGGDLLAIAVGAGQDPAQVGRLVAAECGLPRAMVRTRAVDELPRLPTGKPDYEATASLIAQEPAAPAAGRPSDLAGRGDGPTPDTVRELFAELLDRPDASLDDSFVSLGGDSLSYVETSIRLEAILGQLPPNWHTTPIRELAAGRRERRLRLRAVEASVALRAAAIVMIVGTHIGLLSARGGAHVLLAVAGFNFARFQVTSAERRQRLRRQFASIARIVAPSVAFIAAAYLVTTDYDLANIVLLNRILGPETWASTWHFWFVEVLVHTLVVMAAVLAIPWVDRMERRFPFAFALALVGIGLVTRYGIVEVGLTNGKPAFWLFALGWAIGRASTVQHRALLTLVVVATVPGFFGDPAREAVMIAGLVLLLWVRNIVLPVGLSRVAAVLASSSLYIYLTHWQVYPLFDGYAVVALLASVAAGIAYWLLATYVGTASVRAARRVRSLRG
ncbi:MAG: AMP-binding protein [Actinomycetota bacterium]